MAHPQIAVFARLAEGGKAPIRRIEGQQTLLGRASHAIVYDEIHDEIVVPQGFAQAILTFRGAATGEEPPIRVIHGSNTQLQSPDPMTVDPVNNEIFVPENNTVLVFAREAEGNVAPIRVLRVPGEVELGPPGVFPTQGLLVLPGRAGREASDQLMIFDRRAQGDAKPLRIIGGPRTTIDGGIGELRAYRDWIVVAHTAKGRTGAEQPRSVVSVWSIHDEGDVPPRWSMNLGQRDGVRLDVKSFDLDPKNRSIVVATGRKPNNAVLTYHFPELFDGRATAAHPATQDEGSIAARMPVPAALETVIGRLRTWVSGSGN